jgi:hypothetical protein
MDWKQFIADLVSNIAWPAAAITTIFLFRVELAKIVQRLAHIKYKDLELDFEKVKQHAEDLHLDLEPDQPIGESPVFSSMEDQIKDAVERAPATAILLAWSGLETAIASAVSRLAISPDPPAYRSPLHNIEMLTKYSRLSKKHESLLHEMRMLRNKVAHETDSMISITRYQALDYADTAIDLIRHFEKYQRDR